MVRADAGITTLAELRGKRVSTGSPKSGTEVIANRVLQAGGLDPDTDLAAQGLDIGTSVVPNLLVVPTSLDAPTACVLTRTLFEREAGLVAVNPAAENITLQQARQTDPVPLKPGAKQGLDTLGAP